MLLPPTLAVIVNRYKHPPVIHSVLAMKLYPTFAQHSSITSNVICQITNANDNGGGGGGRD